MTRLVPSLPALVMPVRMNARICGHQVSTATTSTPSRMIHCTTRMPTRTAISRAMSSSRKLNRVGAGLAVHRADRGGAKLLHRARRGDVLAGQRARERVGQLDDGGAQGDGEVRADQPDDQAWDQ